MEKISKFLVNSPKQILTHLKTLLAEKCLIAAGFGENHSFLTAILEIDEKTRIIIIDCGPKEYLNKELLSSGIVECKADLKGIKVLFEGRDVKRAGKLDQPALSIKIPDQIYWVQRRMFYRVRSPLSKNSYCTITFQSSESEDAKTLSFKLFDLSISGFSIIGESLEQAKEIRLDTELNNCKLVLNDAETHTISFIPRNRLAVNPNSPAKNQRIGCEFVDLTPRAENAFLRYMQGIEREIKKKFD
jgi:c-di-GMP-binding flagellar brake protein YcgR